jgi:hypothetical protein
VMGLALAAGSAAVAQTDAATAQRLMRESGLWKQLEGVGPQAQSGIKATLSERRPPVGDAETERIVGIAGDAFAAARLRAVAQATLAKRTKATHVAALLAWFGSPSGRAVTKLEEDAAFDDRGAEAPAQDRALLESLPASRRALLKQLGDVTRSGEALANMTINTTLAVQLGALSATPNAPGPSPAELRKYLEAQRPRMVEALGQLAVAGYARMYASAPDADLARYIAFLRSPAGAHFTDVALRAVDAALVDAAGTLGRNLVEAKGRART